MEIEIRAKIQDNRVLAEELFKFKGKSSENANKIDFQTKNLNKLQEENKWNQKELEKTKNEFSDYRSTRDKKINELEIELEKQSKEVDLLKKENHSYKAKSDTYSKENKKLEENKQKMTKFVNEVVGINEALVNKINLLQDKERSRMKEKDEGMKHLFMGRNNSTKRMESPMKSKSTPMKQSNKL